MRALQLACTLWTILIVLALPSWGSQGIFTSPDVHSTQAFKKRIAIVGAGTAGVSTLKTLLVDLPDALGNDWDIVAFEQRDSVGGVWLPHAGPVPTPPELPETPLYPRLKTNTPHPTMTIPHFTFPPETALFPRHETVQRYHAHVLSHFNLTSHVKLSSRVVEARWTGQSWNLTVENRASSHGVHLPALQYAEFDHLIVANGHYHYPYEPVIEGLNQWRQREDKNVLHSIYFRRGEDFANKTVLVIGGGASGRDAARQITDYASSTIMSRKNTTYRGAPEEPELPSVIPKPHVTRFTRHGVWFDDGSFRSDVDTVLLATGYEHQVPFLTRGGHLKIVGRDAQNDVELSTNLRYIRPLFRHIFALDPSLPPTALAFVGLPIFVSNAITSTSQALVIGHAINNASILPSRGEMLVDLHTSEERFRSAGYEPGYVGHRLISLPDDQDLDAGAAYQDGLVRMLQNVGLGGYGIVPPASKNFTEEWRRFGRAHASLLKRGWERVERMGCDAVRTWIGGVKTEEQWADVVKELSSWEERNEEIILEDREDVEVSNLRK